jgi:transcriptional regulator with XRE-family HTH domain
MTLIRLTGSQLHAARVMAGLSREEVAGRAGLCRHSIRKWELDAHSGAMCWRWVSARYMSATESKSIVFVQTQRPGLATRDRSLCV